MFTILGLRLAKIVIINPVSKKPKIIPPIGAITIPAKILLRPSKTNVSKPIPAIPAPIIPPTNEWLLEIGNPKYVHSTLQVIAPAKPPTIM